MHYKVYDVVNTCTS